MHILDQFPPITAEREDSFARMTIEKRFPKIIADIKKHNPGKHEAELDAILADQFIRRIELPESERANWESFFSEYENESWFTTPFFFLEIYFYKRINLLFQGEDPFRKSKQEDLISNPEFLKQVDRFYAQLDNASLKEVLLLSLWGNKADLSLMNRIDQSSENAQFSNENLLIDHSIQVEEKLKHAKTRIDIVLDNAGIELLTDLILVDYLIRKYNIPEIVLHFKAEPLLVSDALQHDLDDLLHFLSEYESLSSLTELVGKINMYVDGKHVRLSSSLIWEQPVHFYKKEFGLDDLFENSDFIVLKGDANYRRILGDKNIPFTTSTSILDGVYSKSIVALRTLKSEIVIGISEDIFSQIYGFSKDWYINGTNGVIFYVL
jgi:uncharacterized protein with ATP-grasp and redox domains